MKIGLWSDNHNFPSLVLMKLSAYHKAQGDKVEMLNHLNHYDRVYASKTFSFTEDLDDKAIVYADEIVRGGTGYAIKTVDGREEYDAEKDTPLPKEVEHMTPDYSLYPEYKYAVGFLTRGCPRGCGFCVVTRKEGRSQRVADLSEFWTGQREIKLLDPNILACKDRELALLQLVGSLTWVDFTQGVDARFLDKDSIELLNHIKTKRIHFAWDLPQVDMTEHLQFYADHGAIKDYRKRTVYILTNYNSTPEEDLWRIYTVRDMGFTPFQMVYDRAHAPRETKMMQRWCNSKMVINSVRDFKEYRA